MNASNPSKASKEIATDSDILDLMLVLNFVSMTLLGNNFKLLHLHINYTC